MANKRARIVWFNAAAKRFSVHPDTLREWIAEGRFPAPRGDGNRLYYTEAELDAIIEHGFYGRWKPQAAAGNAGRKEPETPARGRKERDLPGSSGAAP